MRNGRERVNYGIVNPSETWRKYMTNGKTSATAADASGDPAAKSSDERRFLDALEDDEVKEVLRTFHQSQESSSAKRTLAK
jgi:hypothetical protein